MNTALICLIVGVVVLLVIFLAAAIKIVPEYKRLVVFRLGRCIGPKGPGLVLLIPFIDRPVSVDLREQVREIPTQASITQDNAPVSIDFLWYYKVFDPVESVLQVQNFELAAQGIATTTLRSVIGGILLDGVLSEREKINTALRARLEDSAGNARDSAVRAAQDAARQAKEAALAADRYAHDEPWRVAGAALAVGALIGFIFSRR